MSELTPLEDIFFAALDIESPRDRDRYLDEVCAGDSDLRQRVDRLLAAQVHAGSFLEHPAAEATVGRPDREILGRRIGAYKLLQEIGEGGFGVVYMAEQMEPVRRKVALKIIKPGMDSREVVARFEAERQALAMMDHPNIAKVLDAGTTESGRPYFVMELIKGLLLTDYCDRNDLTTQQRLDLFKQVCRAVQHAHQKGIIHRDIKPSNVLVTLHDGCPVPKVIDFGIAKALNQQLTQKTLFTRYGQMVGTPAYMSPEQAEMSGLDVDTRSDVYSLGVLLYELLTGTTPFDEERLRSAGYKEMQRIILEEEPLRPSKRLSTMGDELTGISSHRGVEPQRLQQLLRGELDWIVMRSLEKERGQRYESASALAADVERFTRREPIEAGPPSPWYRLRKYHQRHRAALALISSVVLVLVASTTVSTLLGMRAVRDRRKAQGAIEIAEDRLQQLLETQRSLLERVKGQALGYAMSGNRDKALVESELARRMGADEAWCGLIDGLALLFSGEADDATQVLLQAKQADPESIAIRCALAIGYSMTGEGDKWVAECEEMKSMELPPDDPEAHLLMAYNREGRGTPDELQSLLDRYFQLRGDSVVGRIVRAIVLSAIAARTRDPEFIRQAERAVLVAVELAPTNDVVLTAMMRVHRAGYQYYSLQEVGDQAEHYRQLAEATVTTIRDSCCFAPAHEAAAEFLFEELGDADRARQHWDVARKLGFIDSMAYVYFLLKTEGPESAVGDLSSRRSTRVGRALIAMDLPNHRTQALLALRQIARDLEIHWSARTVAAMLLRASGDAEADAYGLQCMLDGMGNPNESFTKESRLLNDINDFPADKVKKFGSYGLLLLGLKMIRIGERDNARQSFVEGKVEAGALYDFWQKLCEFALLGMDRNDHWPESEDASDGNK